MKYFIIIVMLVVAGCGAPSVTNNQINEIKVKDIKSDDAPNKPVSPKSYDLNGMWTLKSSWVACGSSGTDHYNAKIIQNGEKVGISNLELNFTNHGIIKGNTISLKGVTLIGGTGRPLTQQPSFNYTISQDGNTLTGTVQWTSSGCAGESDVTITRENK